MKKLISTILLMISAFIFTCPVLAEEVTAQPTRMDNFIESLKIMGLGMLGIFIVMILIYIIILLIGKIPEKKDKSDND